MSHGEMHPRIQYRALVRHFYIGPVRHGHCVHVGSNLGFAWVSCVKPVGSAAYLQMAAMLWSAMLTWQHFTSDSIIYNLNHYV